MLIFRFSLAVVASVGLNLSNAKGLREADTDIIDDHLFGKSHGSQSPAALSPADGRKSSPTILDLEQEPQILLPDLPDEELPAGGHYILQEDGEARGLTTPKNNPENTSGYSNDPSTFKAPFPRELPTNQVIVSPEQHSSLLSSGRLQNPVDLRTLIGLYNDLPFMIAKDRLTATFGSYELYEFLYRIGKKVQERLPWYKLRLNDLSAAHGGRLCFRNGRRQLCHGSHQYGVDADVGYIFTDPELLNAPDMPDWDLEKETLVRSRGTTRWNASARRGIRSKLQSAKNRVARSYMRAANISYGNVQNHGDVEKSVSENSTRVYRRFARTRVASNVPQNKGLRTDVHDEVMWEMLKEAVNTQQMLLVITTRKIKKHFCELAIRNGEIQTLTDDTTTAGEVLRRMYTEGMYHVDHFHFRVKCSSLQPNCYQQDDPPTGDTRCESL